MQKKITEEKLKKYLNITEKAIDIVKSSPIDEKREEYANDLLDMAERYFSDAKHYFNKGEWVTSFAAVNYAHAWLDAGARIGLFKVKDNKLFTVDDE